LHEFEFRTASVCSV